MARSVAVWLRKALADRDEQIDFIAENSPRAAVEQGDRIAHQVSQLVQHPELGRVGRKPGTRERVISRTPFIVVYRINGQRIELLRLLHGAQQWPKKRDERE